MAESSRIVTLGGDEAAAARQQEPSRSAEADDILSLDSAWEAEDEVRAPRSFGWVVPLLFVSAALAWSGYFVWAQQESFLQGVTPQQWITLAGQWALPMVLIVALWLLAMRSSSREASRFGDAARLLADESAKLESRLIVVNRELSLAREFIAAQSRDLESLGRVASDRLSQSAERLDGLIQSNRAEIDSIASVSTTAVENMDKLRGDLPVIANSARDVASQIGNAGRTAQTQLGELVGGFNRLNEFGAASERQVQSLKVKIEAALAGFEAQARQLEEIAGTRFGAIEESSQAFRMKLDQQEIEALAAIRRRADTLAEELASNWTALETQESSALAALQLRLSQMRDEAATISQDIASGQDEGIAKWKASIDTMREHLTEAIKEVSAIDSAALERTRKRLEALSEEAEKVDSAMRQQLELFEKSIETRRNEQEVFEAQAAESLEERLRALDAMIAERQQGQIDHAESLAARGEAVAARLGELDREIERIGLLGNRNAEALTTAMDTLGSTIDRNLATLKSTDSAIAGLTDASVRLLELIQAGATHSREELPKAIDAAQQWLEALEERARSASDLLGQAGERSKGLSDYVLSVRNEGTAALEQLDELHARLAEQGDAQAGRIAELRHAMGALSEESDALARRAEGDLGEAIEAFRDKFRGILAELENGSSAAIGAIAARIGEESAEAVERAVHGHAASAIGQLEQAATHAASSGRETARLLRDQLAKVDELAGNLESRVARARERAEEQVDNDFARRVALITESLHSNAIDISKALTNDVTDTAWASYLRGDRGIFTRRAVRLLDNSEARDVAEVYDRDEDFREHVNRYIHDFEAMLRSILSTRDGHALGVTLLSSDMGKLYVALAQAIERLRD